MYTSMGAGVERAMGVVEEAGIGRMDWASERVTTFAGRFFEISVASVVSVAFTATSPPESEGKQSNSGACGADANFVGTLVDSFVTAAAKSFKVNTVNG